MSVNPIFKTVKIQSQIEAGKSLYYKVGTSMTLPATWAEKGKAILPLSGICVRKPQFSKPLDEEDDLRLSNMNFFKVSDLKLKKTITPVVYTGTIRERQMKNYIDYLSASLGSTLGNLENCAERLERY